MTLSHADRSRVVTEPDIKQVFAKGGVLVDGFVAGAWKISRAKGTAALEIEPFGKLSKKDQRALEKEGLKLLDFGAPETKAPAVRFLER